MAQIPTHFSQMVPTGSRDNNFMHLAYINRKLRKEDFHLWQLMQLERILRT